jgi:hypothetical protein
MVVGSMSLLQDLGLVSNKGMLFATAQNQPQTKRVRLIFT